MKKIVANLMIIVMVLGGVTSAGFGVGLEVGKGNSSSIGIGDGHDNKDDPGIGWRY
ncbi:hypothetical protein LG311_19605 [Sutcliffiella horikoshii]|uniref:hypothetical protein n=1 Tax=Sutcliffiella horikoshii TaxID=79883 RepID=UPI003850FA7D